MPPKRRRAWVGFVLFAALAIVGLVVLDGAAAGVTLFAAMLLFIGACMYALLGEDREASRSISESGFIGWFGRWF